MSTFLCVTECAIKHEDRFLMITRPEGTHAGGILSFPGGKVDYSDGENAADILVNAVKREVFEELGLQLIDPLRYVTSSFFVDTVTERKVLDTIFLCDIKKTKLTIIPSKREVAAFHWLTFEEINRHANCPPWLGKYLEKCL